ncbi:MAG TPA: M23 family metallopeptidase [Steroidobacteraceae bacterium]|jgi:murein DD-endopeptidase MepM/ murein hydrolase activator NlpD|nr:M23 family metallopeptidase [Steroidobacteraceae bacterium]
MNVIFFSRREGRARHLNLAHPVTLGLIIALALGVIAGTFAVGMQLGERSMARLALLTPAATFRAEQKQIVQLRVQLQDKVDALSMRLGMMDAHLIRLNALGKRLTEMANINSREFDFDHDPPLGGPEDTAAHIAAMPDLTGMIDNLSQQIDQRSAQFGALANVLLGRQLSAEIRPQGRPVRAGYISSGFGERMDPFTGEEGIHKGVDFAAPAGTDVLAVAAGIVTWAGPREGYGNLVEINHGKGYSTRYAHNETVLVKIGDEVQRGQALATVGSTGRSTGPHVHFEVLRNGVQIDPMTFVRR